MNQNLVLDFNIRPHGRYVNADFWQIRFKNILPPPLQAVITKADAEEQAKMAQDKLTKGMKYKASAEVSAVEFDKTKLQK